MQLYALVEEWPDKCLVFFRELPGCCSSAPTSEEAMRLLPSVMEKYFHWLGENGVVLLEEDGDPTTTVVKEHITCGSASMGPLFEADRAAQDDQEMDNALNVAATARALIIELMSTVPPRLHDQAVTPGGKSLMQSLLETMETENWYVSRLTEHPATTDTVASMDTDALVMRIFEDAMDHEVLFHELGPEERVRVLLHEGEEWTAAKVLRRLTIYLYKQYFLMLEIAHHLSVRNAPFKPVSESV